LITFASVRQFSKKYLFLLAGLLLVLTACGPREIPDKKMGGIIHDILLANAYYIQFGSGRIDADSVDFYMPILEKYGYDVDDFRHTLDRWALQKSSRLTDLISAATADIQRENENYLRRALMRRRIDTLINAHYLDTLVFRPDSLWAGRPKDRDSLIFRLSAPTGTYHLRYGYWYTTGDQNEYLSMRYRVRDSVKNIVESGSRSLSRGLRKNQIELSFTAPARSDSLEIVLAEYPEKPRPMAFAVDSVLITYNAPIDELRQRFQREIYRIEPETDLPYGFHYLPKDSGALRPVPLLRADTTARAEL
jgi:hypothetical protein